MRTWYSFFTIILILSTFSELFAEGGYIGENPGLNFYTTIDEGNYSITKKMVSVRLKETPKLDEFAKGCVQAQLLKGGNTDPEILDAIQNGNYEKLIALLSRNGAGYISTDQFHALVLCISERYQTIVENVKNEKQVIETISSIGLYTDGDTTNSDYDILADIGKINSIIFSTPLKYDGVKNAAGSSFGSFLAGNPVPSLFPPSIGSGSTGTGTNSGSGTTGSGSNTNPSLESLIGNKCFGSSGKNITDMMDDDLSNELNNLLNNGENASDGGGYTLGTIDTPVAVNLQNANNTSANDFFHAMPCSSIFCIDIKMNGGNQNLLGGGKNISIEGILDKHSAILDKIKDTSLQYQKMTNNEGGLPYPDLKLMNIVGGAKIYLANAPQISRRDKKDETPEKKKEDLMTATRCGLASSGLPTDPIQANGIGGAGFTLRNTTNSENYQNRNLSLGTQSTDETNYTGCVGKSMDVGRKAYYDSFSTDLTEIQAFTSAMQDELNAILEIGVQLNNKIKK